MHESNGQTLTKIATIFLKDLNCRLWCLLSRVRRLRIAPIAADVKDVGGNMEYIRSLSTPLLASF